MSIHTIRDGLWKVRGVKELATEAPMYMALTNWQKRSNARRCQFQAFGRQARG